MAETRSYLAVFADIDPAVHAVDQLRALGVGDDQLNIIAGIPVTEAMLGRPRQWTNVPRLALGGALAGFALGSLLSFVVPFIYPLHVGGHGVVAGPPSFVVLFEMTMLGMLVSTFLGVFLDSRFPSYSPKEYVPAISDGKVAVLFQCGAEKEARLTGAMKSAGAESVQLAEADQL